MKGDHVRSESADGASRMVQGRRASEGASRRSLGIGIAFTTAAMVLAACSGGPSSPHVASLGTSTSLGTSKGSGSGSTSTSPTAKQ